MLLVKYPNQHLLFIIHLVKLCVNVFLCQHEQQQQHHPAKSESFSSGGFPHANVSVSSLQPTIKYRVCSIDLHLVMSRRLHKK